MSDLELCYLSAVQAVERFKARALSPVELMRALIARAERVEPVINAFTDTYFEEALAAARRAEDRYMKTDGRPRPLEGVPAAVKDSMEMAGRRLTLGSLIYKDRIAESTHPAVARLLDAGAIVHARTTTPEFASAGVCYSRLHGTTVTPWNAKYTSGGSSGGSGASLAAGSTTLATGSDIAGSIRVPAACCGVVGYKPPYGRVPASPPFNLDMYAVAGPMARTVGDCVLMLNVMAGHHPEDMATLRERLDLPRSFPGIEGWRIGFSETLGLTGIAPEVRGRFHATLEVLRALGAEVREVDLGWTPALTATASLYFDHIFGRWLGRMNEAHGDLLTDYTVFYAERGGRTTSEDLLRCYELAGAWYRPLGRLLEEVDALVTPTLATHEVAAEQKPWEELTIDGEKVDADFGWVLAHPFNMFGRCPVLSVPMGIATNGLPTSLQIVARSFDDRRAFQLGAALEAAQPWLDRAERRPML